MLTYLKDAATDVSRLWASESYFQAILMSILIFAVTLVAIPWLPFIYVDKLEEKYRAYKRKEALNESL